MRTRKATDPASLNEELVSARERYNSTVSSVIDRAQVRREQIGQVITDLRSEDDALASVVASAKSDDIPVG